MIERLTFLTIVHSDADGVILLGLNPQRHFPDDATADEINALLFRRGLRPCPHSHHSHDEEFAECTATQAKITL